MIFHRDNSAEAGLCRLIHNTVQGRARYKVDGLYRSEPLQQHLQFRLCHREEIRQVSINPLTGNLLILFDPEDSPSAISSLIEEIVREYREARTEPVVSPLPRALIPPKAPSNPHSGGSGSRSPMPKRSRWSPGI